MRLECSSEIVLDEVWRERLSSAELVGVRRRTETLRRRLGYA
jgi:hypothetical protein